MEHFKQYMKAYKLYMYSVNKLQKLCTEEQKLQMYEHRDVDDEKDARADILTTTFTLDTGNIPSGTEPIELLYAKTLRVMLLINEL